MKRLALLGCLMAGQAQAYSIAVVAPPVCVIGRQAYEGLAEKVIATQKLNCTVEVKVKNLVSYTCSDTVSTVKIIAGSDEAVDYVLSDIKGMCIESNVEPKI